MTYKTIYFLQEAGFPLTRVKMYFQGYFGIPPAVPNKFSMRLRSVKVFQTAYVPYSPHSGTGECCVVLGQKQTSESGQQTDHLLLS